jgi:hypothetical protein
MTDIGQFVQPRRNYASVEYLEDSGDLVFDIRVERTPGGGDTKRYVRSKGTAQFQLKLQLSYQGAASSVDTREG